MFGKIFYNRILFLSSATAVVAIASGIASSGKCPLPDIEYALITYEPFLTSGIQYASPGDIAYIQCPKEKEYEVEMNGTSPVKCSEDGFWRPDLPTCVPIRDIDLEKVKQLSIDGWKEQEDWYDFAGNDVGLNTLSVVVIGIVGGMSFTCMSCCSMIGKSLIASNPDNIRRGVVIAKTEEQNMADMEKLVKPDSPTNKQGFGKFSKKGKYY